MNVRILGSGTTSGVPRIGNDWGVCDPHEPRNRRTRSAILIESDGARLLVDCGPDMREQLLADGTGRVDRVIAIGECGLDYYYDKSDRAAQRERFAAHIEASRQTGLPLVVHTRDAEDDTAAMLTEAVGKGGVTGVLHCFTGSAGLARIGLDLGFYVSMSGIVTFKNARDLQEVAKSLPQDRLLVETDSPFLAPVPHRGKTCEPAFVADTAAFLADLRGESLDQLAAATTANFFKLFGKAQA